MSYPVPLSVFVEQNNNKFGVHLVAILAERQITSLKRHIHQVPADGNNTLTTYFSLCVIKGVALNYKFTFGQHIHVSKHKNMMWIFPQQS